MNPEDTPDALAWGTSYSDVLLTYITDDDILLLCTVVHADKLSAEGGHGVGITFPAPTDTTGVTQVKTVDFDPYRHWTNDRIRKDITVLLSDTVQQRIVASGDSTIQTTVDSSLKEREVSVAAIH